MASSDRYNVSSYRLLRPGESGALLAHGWVRFHAQAPVFLRRGGGHQLKAPVVRVLGSHMQDGADQ